MAEATPTTTTRAWVYTTGGYPSCLSQASTPAPTANGAPLAPTQLLVRVRAAALNPVDIQLMNLPIWSLPYLSSRQKGFGADFAGTVVAAGRQSGFAEGDAVFGLHFAPGGDGTLAEVIRVDVAKAVVLRKPEAWAWAQAAALPLVWLTSRTVVGAVQPYVAKGDDGAERPPTVVVLGGSSATGMYCVHLAARRGWRVVATCSGRNAEFVRGMGAEKVIDYTQFAHVRDQVAAERPVAIMDCVGGTECLGLARRYVTIVGDKTSRAAMGGALTYLWNPWMLLRSVMGRFGLRSEAYDCVNLKMKKEYLEEATQLRPDKIIVDSTFGFDQVKEALERLNSGRCRGKVVVEVGE